MIYTRLVIFMFWGCIRLWQILMEWDPHSKYLVCSFYMQMMCFFYSTTMLICEFLFSIVVLLSIVEGTNNYKGSFVHGGMGMSCTWMNGDLHK